MPIAATVESCLERHRMPYALISHPHAVSSRDTAAAAAVAPSQVAKAVMLRDERAYLMVVVPSDQHVPLRRLSQQLGRQLRLVEDSELATLFGDCEAGAIPPLGLAYGIETIVDDDLFQRRQVCFVAGVHHGLLCVSQDGFGVLMQGTRRASIADRAPAVRTRAPSAPAVWP